MASTQEISDTTPQWWELQNIPTEVIRELRRRNNSNNIGMNIPTPFTNVTFNFEDTYKQYKGPMTPWVRIFSNSTGKSINGLVPKSDYLNKNYQSVDYDGFILSGGDGFYDAYGYKQNKPLSDGLAVIGYEANGKPHYIDNRYRNQYQYSTERNPLFPQNNQTIPLVPAPAISSVTVRQSKEYITFSSFKFKCFGLAQLEYLTPFFLTAGINVFIEFGWNLFNQKSLINLANIRECWDVVSKPQTALDRSIISNGNYGCVTGIITKYSFTSNDGFVYECNVEMTSRQGLYAGMRTDNNAKTSISTNDGNSFNREALDLKTFIKLYLPTINEVVTQPEDNPGTQNTSNFLNYILAKIEKEKDDKQTNDSEANAQQIKNSTANVNETMTKIGAGNTSFYGGKTEDRIFMGRLEKVYSGLKKRPIAPASYNPYASGVPSGGPYIALSQNQLNSISTAANRPVLEPIIDYGTIHPDLNPSGYNQVSCDDDKTDFDAKDGATEVWMQLDFVFEMINLFMSNRYTNQFKIDISDVIVNAHPNLISCDQHVLIPNPVSPKINIGTPSSKTPGKGGYLKRSDAVPLQKINTFAVTINEETGEVTADNFALLPSSETSGNQFLNQQADITVSLDKILQSEIDKKTVDYRKLTNEQSYYLACDAARKTFKTRGRVRDNIDAIINYLYYNKINKNPTASASFPAKDDIIVTRTNKDGKSVDVTYKKYYYGKLKHLYISKTKLIQIAESTDTTNFKQFINAILNVINESVDNFWKFEIQEAQDKNGNSVVSIVDKNTVNFEALREIYMFELGSTNNVVRSVNFDVSLTNEQAVNVLYGGQNSSNLTETLTKQTNTATDINQLNTTINAINNVPFLKFNDRMDKFQLGLLANQQSGSIYPSTVPGSTSGIVDQNNDIADLQKYGDKSKSGVLCVTVKNLNGNYSSTIEQIQNDQLNRRNYKFLCLPPSMKGKLRQMLDDNDFKNNIAKYSGVADNFTVTLRFDGIFALRNLQCFAINNLPKPYVPGNIVFQILEVEHTLESGKWETVVTALVRCIGTSKLEYKIV